MRQDVGLDITGQTVRGLLTALAPEALRHAGERVAESERRLADGDLDAGMELGEAIGDWSALGGYELEAQWDSSCRRIVRAGFPEIADRPAATLSGGERKQLVLDVLLRSEADVLLLDEPDNFLDVPAKLALERTIRASRKTILMISHDRAVLDRRSRLDRHARGPWSLGARRGLRVLPGGPPGPAGADGRRGDALAGGGEAPA